MNMRYLFHFLRIMKIPGLFSIMKDWQALVRMHFLFAAYEAGLLDALKCPRDRTELIEKLHVLRPDLLDALLQVGLATKELGRKGERFYIRGKRAGALVNRRGDMLAAMVQANVTYYNDAYRNASGRLRGGEPGDDLGGMGDLVARFSRIGEPILHDFLAGIVSGGNPMRVLDVGCGSGIFLHSIHRANANAMGFGLDVDEAAVRQARNNIAGWGLEKRFRVFQGDIRCLPGEITGPFDLITLFNVLYYVREEDREELLAGLRTMLAPGGIVAIVSNCRGEKMDIGAANLNMVNCSLKGLTRLPDLEEIKAMLGRCGFHRVVVHRFIPGGSFFGVIARNE